MRADGLILAALIAGCATAPREVPSLAPRAAEAIDPRLPVRPQLAPGPADPAFETRLAELLGQVRAGDHRFLAAAGAAERLAAAAAARESESWIAAQQALSALEASRAMTTRALGDIDALGAARIADKGGLAAGDAAALAATVDEAMAIERRQAARIARLQARLGG